MYKKNKLQNQTLKFYSAPGKVALTPSFLLHLMQTVSLSAVTLAGTPTQHTSPWGTFHIQTTALCDLR